MNSNTTPCSTCSGTQFISQRVSCDDCSGTGTASTLSCAEPGTHNGNACGSCRSSGKRPRAPDCSKCSGTGGYTRPSPCLVCCGGGLVRRPTDSSFVTFDGTENNADGQSDSVKKATWMYGRDVRDQVANAPQPVGRHKKGYPSIFHNGEKLPLQSSAPLQHIPLIPGQTTTHTDNLGSGTWRAVFNNNNRQIIDVIYHNANAGKTPNGRSDKFTLGHYYPQKVGSEADADEQTVEDDSPETGDDGEDPKSTEDQSTSDL